MKYSETLKSTKISRFLPGGQQRSDLGGDKNWSLKKVFEGFKKRQERFLKALKGN